ncbi:hypothetical protein CR513_46632, partial [Mucuna pruriens]
MTTKEAESESESDGWKLWFDGASNLLGNEIGAMLASLDGQCSPFSTRLGFNYTNNMVEYEACAMGIAMALEHQVKKLKVFGDSALVNYQLRREWETHDARLILYHNHIMEMSEHFDKLTFHYKVNALATLSSMLQVNKEQEMTIHLDQDEVGVDDQPWYHNIKKYLEEGAYPPRAFENDKRTQRRLVVGFFLSETILYKKSADWTLLCCINDKKPRESWRNCMKGPSAPTPMATPKLAKSSELIITGPKWSRIAINM